MWSYFFQLSSGGQDALFRKTGNFVGTSDVLIEATTVSIGETDAANGMVQSSNIGFEFNELYFLSKNDHPYELIESAINYNKTERDVSIFIKNINIDTEKLKKDFDLFLDNKLFFTSNLKNFKIKFNFDKPQKDYYFSGLFINTNFC